MDEGSKVFWKRFASRNDVPLEGLSFLYDTYRHAQESLVDDLDGPMAPRRHCSAAFICRWIVALAKSKFGDEYVAALGSWNLDTSEKVGNVVYALIRRGLMLRKYPDSQSDFDEQFDFSRGDGRYGRVPAYPYPLDFLPLVFDPYRFSLLRLLIVMTTVALLLGSFAISK
jgi:uncharacterized repeat protein (TIGR04138 family)